MTQTKNYRRWYRRISRYRSAWPRANNYFITHCPRICSHCREIHPSFFPRIGKYSAPTDNQVPFFKLQITLTLSISQKFQHFNKASWINGFLKFSSHGIPSSGTAQLEQHLVWPTKHHHLSHRATIKYRSDLCSLSAVDPSWVKCPLMRKSLTIISPFRR